MYKILFRNDSEYILEGSEVSLQVAALDPSGFGALFILGFYI